MTENVQDADKADPVFGEAERARAEALLEETLKRDRAAYAELASR